MTTNYHTQKYLGGNSLSKANKTFFFCLICGQKGKQKRDKENKKLERLFQHVTAHSPISLPLCSHNSKE